MNITNKRDLPDGLYRAICNDPYSRGSADYSVTELLAPPRAIILARRHGDLLEVDASDRLWSVLGQAVHVLVERAEQNAIAEKRYSIMVGDIEVSGGMDRYSLHEGLLQDYKLTNVKKVMGGISDEWVSQLNIYTQMLRMHGYTVNRAEIIPILRNWDEGEARDKASKGYPQKQSDCLNIPLWTEAKAMKFISEKVYWLEMAKKSLPLCSPTERWAKPWTQVGRCRYCDASKVCTQYQDLKAKEIP